MDCCFLSAMAATGIFVALGFRYFFMTIRALESIVPDPRHSVDSDELPELLPWTRNEPHQRNGHVQ